MASGSTKAVVTAIVGNSVVMCAKFLAFSLTGSGSMLSEGIHSAADVSNQCLLLLGIKRSQGKATAELPYGYGRAQFFWALVSAVGIFFLGCGVTLYHGINGLLHPHEVEDPTLALGVLAFALVVEGATLVVAAQAVSQSAKEAGMSFLEYIKRGSDPMGVAVLLEDGAAVLGVIIAAIALGLTALTGNPVFDALGSIAIGLLLGAVALFLVQRNRIALLGQAASEERTTRILRVLAQDPMVESVRDVKATVVGSNAIRFKAEVEFDGAMLARKWLRTQDPAVLLAELDSPGELQSFLVRYTDHIIDQLGDEVDRIESEIKKAVPEVRHVDIETD